VCVGLPSIGEGLKTIVIFDGMHKHKLTEEDYFVKREDI
jgi:hypothetical protein